MNAAAGQIKEFSGVLVSRKYRPGHTYIQLLFRTADDLRLCLSRDPQMVRGLHLGESYQVAGPRHHVGQTECVRDPIITPIVPEQSNRRVWFAVGAVCLVLLIGTGGVVFAMHSGAPTEARQQQKQPSSSEQHTLSEQTESSEAPANNSTTSTTSQSSAQPTPTPQPVTGSTNRHVVQPAPVPTPTPQPPTQPEPPAETPPAEDVQPTPSPEPQPEPSTNQQPDN